eukprot:1148044-Pelagomonas_calceolata.AAC.4
MPRQRTPRQIVKALRPLGPPRAPLGHQALSGCRTIRLLSSQSISPPWSQRKVKFDNPIIVILWSRIIPHCIKIMFHANDEH